MTNGPIKTALEEMPGRSPVRARGSPDRVLSFVGTEYK